MTISDGMNTKNLTLYSPAQPLLQDDQVVWPNMDDFDMDIDSIQQLMMISLDSFVNIKEEDDVISSIIQNEYGTQLETSSKQDCLLESILPLPSELHYFESAQLLHSLLPHEIDSQPIVQISMAEKVVKTTIVPGRELNILSPCRRHNIIIPYSYYKSTRMLFLGSI